MKEIARQIFAGGMPEPMNPSFYDQVQQIPQQVMDYNEQASQSDWYVPIICAVITSIVAPLVVWWVKRKK